MTPASPLLLAALVTLWHATQGAEREALERTVAQVNADAAGRFEVRALAVPFDGFARKLETTIPEGQGPDLFLAAHDRLGDWARLGLVAPLETPTGTAGALVAGVSLGGVPHGIPVGYKTLILYYNKDLLPQGPPPRRELLEAFAATMRPKGVYPLAYDASSFFFHAPFFLAAGGKIFDGDRYAVFDDPRSFEDVLALKKAGVIPDEATSRTALELFNAGRAAIVLSGPWFAGDIELADERWGAAPLWAGHGSLVSVEALFLSKRAADPEAARAAARALAARWVRLPGSEALARAQEPALRAGLVTPARPEMSLVWEPAGDLLKDVLDRGVPVDAALRRAREALGALAAADPPPADPGPYADAAWVAAFVLALFLLVRAFRRDAFRRALRPEARFAYAVAAPGIIAMLALVVAPAVAGALMSLHAFRGEERWFVGIANFAAILTTPRFYLTLLVTALWTVTNVALHVAIGLGLALLLRRPWLGLRGAYRVLLILPWAVPSYITALVWSGMFDRQFGAINALLMAIGLEPVSWFQRFSTAFAANLTTNTWLGFPFMMVMALGALQGIPPELEEAAALEGASRAQRLKLVILPAIRPVLFPAIILGSIWTFNMFNVIFLVSRGEPAGATEILISEAYKWAFVRQHRYGYAAAYAVLIFAILLAYSRLIVGRGEATQPAEAT